MIYVYNRLWTYLDLCMCTDRKSIVRAYVIVLRRDNTRWLLSGSSLTVTACVCIYVYIIYTYTHLRRTYNSRNPFRTTSLRVMLLFLLGLIACTETRKLSRPCKTDYSCDASVVYNSVYRIVPILRHGCIRIHGIVKRFKSFQTRVCRTLYKRKHKPNINCIRCYIIRTLIIHRHVI